MCEPLLNMTVCVCVFWDTQRGKGRHNKNYPVGAMKFEESTLVTKV